MVFVYTAMGVLCVEHANVLKLCYIELLSGDSSLRLFSLVMVTWVNRMTDTCANITFPKLRSGR